MAQRTCGTMPRYVRLLGSDPAFAQRRELIEQQIQAQAALRAQKANGKAGLIRIPVVVHVVWNSPMDNISDAQIASQIVAANADFRALNVDLANVPGVWSDLVGNPNIEFALATVDPQGQPTSGITRHNTSALSFTDNDDVKSSAKGGADPWPSDRYLNVWVCALGGALLGYASFPGEPAELDGVVVRSTCFGTTGTAAAPFDLGRTFTHEVGHWLDLYHIWGDDADSPNVCGGSDQVDDTPNAAGPNLGTPAFPHISCNNGPNGDMFMNYMDYVDDGAMVMFTRGQVNRIRATLDVKRAIIGESVWTPWFTIHPETVFDHELQQVAAVSRNENSVSLFVIGFDNHVWATSWDPATNWVPWAPILPPGPDRVFDHTVAQITAISIDNSQVDLFVVGFDNVVWTVRWSPVTGWKSWEQIDHSRVFKRSSRIAAVARGTGRIDLYIIGFDNRVWTTSWVQGGNWLLWGHVAPPGPERTFNHELASISAVSRNELTVDHFAVGNNNTVWTTRWFHQTGWLAWTEIDAARTFYQGATLAALSRTKTTIDLFIVGFDNAVWNASYTEPTDWLPWKQIWPGTTFDHKAARPVALARTWSHMDLFVVGFNNAVWSTWWDTFGAWKPWFDIYPAIKFDHSRARICAVARRYDHVDIFVIGLDGAVWSTWWG